MKNILNLATPLSKSLVFLGAFLVAISSSFAQDQTMSDLSPEEKARAMTDRQKEKLGLSDTQEADMYALNLKYTYEMTEIRQEGRSRSTLRKLKDMGARRDEEAKAFLSPEQFTQYQQMNAEMRARVKERRRSKA